MPPKVGFEPVTSNVAGEYASHSATVNFDYIIVITPTFYTFHAPSSIVITS
jgi:hypothetical protein